MNISTKNITMSVVVCLPHDNLRMQIALAIKYYYYK